MDCPFRINCRSPAGKTVRCHGDPVLSPALPLRVALIAHGQNVTPGDERLRATAHSAEGFLW
ncbi:hypothetical protein KIF59_06495 [Enterobacter cloacae subsp. cloacae]|nr:hypothetical protein [Enterobacter cloacae subsp. cloacae]